MMHVTQYSKWMVKTHLINDWLLFILQNQIVKWMRWNGLGREMREIKLNPFSNERIFSIIPVSHRLCLTANMGNGYMCVYCIFNACHQFVNALEAYSFTCMYAYCIYIHMCLYEHVISNQQQFSLGEHQSVHKSLYKSIELKCVKNNCICNLLIKRQWVTI